ncbi:MAG: hypothetical protein N2648_00085 [Aquificaceae bacterium]|nr:hypothetical protein [Aquificaceae bacterium]MCX7989030.1 hypothetical protein [Aquificaceae bacterium]MDW8032098.1 hypothetical protein [Aquificaceae bacterium]MDW8294401.1 hypothetical protein [Aquificaceae bacterium]
MVKWIVGIILAFLLIDHIWVHYGGPTIERLRDYYGGDIKKKGTEKEEVSVKQAYEKSLLDELWEKGKNLLNREKEEKKQ